MTKTLVFSTTKFTLAVQTVCYFVIIDFMLYPFDFYNDEFLLTRDTEAKTKQLVLVAVLMCCSLIAIGIHDTTILITATRLAGYLACYFDKCHEMIQIGCGFAIVALLCVGIGFVLCMTVGCRLIFELGIKPYVQNIKLNAWSHSKIFLAAVVVIGAPITYSDLTTRSIIALNGEEKLIVQVGMTSYITAMIILKLIVKADLKLLSNIKSIDWLLINLGIVFWATIIGMTSAANYVFGLQPVTYYSPNIITFSKGIILFAWPTILTASIFYFVVVICFETIDDKK